MAQSTTQQATAPSPSGGSISATRHSVTPNNPNPRPPPGQIAQSRNSGSSSGRSGAAQRAGIAVPANRTLLFWRDIFPRMANVCGLLGLLLAVIFGVTQWLAQDESIAIAKESELITLALSCSDEKTKSTSVCQQFFDKYPDGPTISRRGNISVDSFYCQDSNEAWSSHVTLEYLTAHLAMATRFVQEQNSRFQSVLNIINLPLSLTQIGSIISRAGKAFSQNTTALMTAWARLQADNNVSYIPIADWLISRPIMSIVAAFLIASVGFLFTTEFGLFLLIGSYVCMADPMMCWVLFGVGKLATLLVSFRRGRMSSSLR